MELSKPIKITVCADGFVSIMTVRNAPLPKRLGSGLPVYSVDTIQEAVDLIQKTCILAPCIHGKKTGTTIEPRVPNWPRAACVEDIHRFGEVLQKADQS